MPRVHMSVSAFKKAVRGHYAAHGRHDLAWRKTHDPYRILVSEVMLQQTQVSRVRAKYAEFLAKFPTVRALASAPVSDVLRVWQGLGYNRRALNLKRAAEAVVGDHGGRFPRDAQALEALPGVGQSTRGAIMAFAFGEPTAFIETNVRSAYLHCFFGDRKGVHDKEILPLIEKTLDRRDPRSWYYALMDYGVHLKATLPNPSRRSRHHVRQSAFKGSNREVRSKILKGLLAGPQTAASLARFTGAPVAAVRKNLADMEKEGFVCKKSGKGTYYIV